MNPISRLRMAASSASEVSEISRPWSTYSPDVATSRQPMMFISVLLPLPDGPSTDRYSPSSISRQTFLSACISSPAMG